MHSLATRNEFLRLRIAGLSFARIARQLGVSKPTLIAWSRAGKPELDSGRAQVQDHGQDEISTNVNQQLAELERRHGALRQELFSRALRDIPTACLETLAGEFHKRIEHFEQSFSGSAGVSTASAPRPLLGGEGKGEGEPSAKSEVSTSQNHAGSEPNRT